MEMPWKKTNAFDKTSFFTRDEKIAMAADPNQSKYVPSGNPQIEAGRANALNPNGGVSKYNLYEYMRNTTGLPKKQTGGFLPK
jgi:hypothetical protein